MTWALILSILFSTWTGPTWYSWDGHGGYILPGVWIGPGNTPGFVAWPAGYAAVLGWHWGPTGDCSSGCDPQTNRATVVDVHSRQPVTAHAAQWMRIRWVALADHDTTLRAIVWQSFGYAPSAGHRKY